MKKTRYIRFAPNGVGARIGINVPPPGAGPLLKNPDESRVKGIPPHKWRKLGNKIYPASIGVAALELLTEEHKREARLRFLRNFLLTLAALAALVLL